MQNMGDIKKVLESQGNTHEMKSKAIQNPRVWLQVQLRVQDDLAFKLMYRTCPTSDLGELYMHGKIRR
jgi:hypothetical protein